MSKTDKERLFHGVVANYGCMADHVKSDYWGASNPCAVHHILIGGKRYHWAVIGLCPGHHQGITIDICPNYHGKLSVHNGNKSGFRAEYGHEWELFLILRYILSLQDRWPLWVEIKLLEYLESPHANKDLTDNFCMVQ